MFNEYKDAKHWQKCRMEQRLTIGDMVGIFCTFVLFPVGMVIASILEA